MAVAKTNPLPNGLYWIDLFSPTSSAPNTKDGALVFTAWTKANAGRVKVRRTETFPEPALGGPIRTWVMFEVVGPPGAFPFGLGYPSISTDPNEASTSATLPELPEFGDWFQSIAGNLEGIALLLVLWELSKKR
jgi:hypothetical protein